MKELSIWQKAQRYDEALERARKLKKDPQGVFYEYSPKEGDTICDYIFPELKEITYNDAMREMAIKAVHALEAQSCIKSWGINPNDVIAWLEKQGEQKLVISDDALREGIAHFGITQYQIDNWLKKYVDVENQCEQKPQGKSALEAAKEEKAEPRFHEGEWIVFDGLTICVTHVVKGFYITTSRDGITNGYDWDIDNLARLWTIQDAMDGDVLIDKSSSGECPFIFRETKPSNIKTDIPNPLTVFGYCGIGGAGFTKSSGWGDTANCTYYPATKEQSDALKKSMADAGYTFDFEKKELRKIWKKNTDKIEPKFKVGDKIYLKLEHRMPDDDTPIADTIHEIIAIDDKHYRFKGSFIFIEDQDKFELVEWSEDDESMLDSAIAFVEHSPFSTIGKGKNNVIDWLKSIKDRVQKVKI